MHFVGVFKQRLEFDPRPVHVAFVVDKVTLEQVFLQALWVSPASYSTCVVSSVVWGWYKWAVSRHCY